MIKIPQVCFILLLQFCPTVAYTQIGSAETQVNVLIGQVLSIEIMQPSVNIQMGMAPDFINGAESGNQNNYIKVTSNSAYCVTVRALTGTFSNNGNNTTLPVNTINIQTTLGDDLTGAGAASPPGLQTMPNTPLSENEMTIINSPVGESARGFNIKYKIPGGQSNAYLNRPPGNYTTQVIYSIVPQ